MIEALLRVVDSLWAPRPKVRLHVIGSAALPAYSPHTNTLEPIARAVKTVVAVNRVHHTAEHASFVRLPLVGSNAGIISFRK